ncbi:hypothetical protein [Agilicoccus flavus]|uniref:hypothetical protein n=1 Tax=Agilicoccus flavus TaxID=2775968 RepID=UPI001CF62BB7|nr:hypothetical protein [Agilicoccus flavus]
MTPRLPSLRSSVPVLAGVGVLLAGCGAPTAPGSSPTGASAPSSSAAPRAGSNVREVASVSPRLVVSHDGGLTALDAATGKVVAETAHPGFLRLSNAGDGRHVMVADAGVFRVYDAGIQAEKHGDHHHYREATPGLTDVTYEAPHAGHVVPHAGRTTLFADGSGDIQVVDSDEIASPSAAVRRSRTDAPHHGVAFELSDGSMATTQGTKEGSRTVQVRKGSKVVAQTTDCIGVHGEAAARPTSTGDVAVFGCEDGPVVYRDGAFHKVPVADAYARTGNLAGSEHSPVVLGDYKVDGAAAKADRIERPTRVSLIDTLTGRLDLLELGSSYWFRSLARGPRGEALVLTYDGKVNVVDPASRKVTARIPAISAWQEKTDWQQPGPAIEVAGGSAYVTDAEQKKVAVVDLATRKVTKTYDLPHTPVEIAVVTGSPESVAEEHAGHGR